MLPIRFTFCLTAIFFSLMIVASPYTVQTTSLREGEENSKKHLIIASLGSPSIINPYFSADYSSAQVESLLFNGLVTFDPDLNPIPDLAKSWSVSENGLSWTFTLRKGVLFHDGTEMTSEDVLFSYNIPRSRDYYGPRGSDFEKIKHIEAIDRYTVRIVLNEPYAPFLSTCSYAVLPSHILKDVPIDQLAQHPFNTKSPVGTGPYQFSSWKDGQYIKLESFSKFFQGTPSINQVYFRIVPDQNAQLIALQSGGIDMMGIPPTDMAIGKRFEKQGKIRLSSTPSLSYTYIGYNLQNPIFQDVRVRKALTHALDRELLVDVVLDGQGQVAHTHGSPLSWSYEEDIPRYPYDIDKAKALLEEAGWRDLNGDGVREKDGMKLSFVLMTNQGNKIREMVAQIVQDQWSKVGVEVKPRLMEWSAFVHDYVETKKFDAVILGWSLGVDPDPSAIWHSKEINRGLNFVSYHNQKLDELLERNTRTMDQQERKEILSQIQKMIAHEQPYTFLYYTNGIMAYPVSLRGTLPHPSASFYQIYNWSFQ